MRPISLVQDEGFLDVIQHCLSWNESEDDLLEHERVAEHSLRF